MDVEEVIGALQKWVIDDGKCMTKASILRQTSLNTRQVESAMAKFYEQNKDLSAMFIIFGKIKSDDGIMRKSMICNQEKLEEAKKTFDEVTSTSIYSLHRNPSTTVQTLLNADWSGRYEKSTAPFEDRLHIVSSVALKGVKKWQKQNPNSVISSFVIPHFMPKVKKEPKKLGKSIIIKSDQHSLKDAFAIAVENNEDEKMEVDELDNTSESVQLKESSKAELGKKKKLQDEKINFPPAKKTDSKKAKVENEGQFKKQKAVTAPNKSKKPPTKSEQAEVSAKKRKSLAKENETKVTVKKEDEIDGENSESTSKVVKNQDVTETYVDDDGMLVTRVVSTKVESDEPVPQQSSALKTKNNDPKPLPKLPTGQKSISSFFKKV